MAGVREGETELLSEINDPGDNIYDHFFTHLHSFSRYITLTTTSTTESQITRPKPSREELNELALFTPFLQKSFRSIETKLLRKPPKFSAHQICQLLKISKLCLCCIEAIRVKLGERVRYQLEAYKARYVDLLVRSYNYKDAVEEGLKLLDSLGKLANIPKVEGSIVPFAEEKEKESLDEELADVIVLVVSTLVKCTAENQDSEDYDYERTVSMIDQLQPWLSVFKECKFKTKIIETLVPDLNQCLLRLLKRRASMYQNLAGKFFSVVLREYSKIPDEKNMWEFASKMCIAVFKQDNLSSSIDEIIIPVCKPDMEGSILIFFEVVCHCADMSQLNTNACGAIASFLKILADNSKISLAPFRLCIRLYAIGFRIQREKDMSVVVSWLDDEKIIPNLTKMHGLLTRHHDVNAEDNDMEFRAGFEKLLCRMYSLPKSTSQDSLCTLDRRTYMISYNNALNFLCSSLSELVVSERQYILGEHEYSLNLTKLSQIQDIFRMFCNLFLCCPSNSDKGSDIKKHAVHQAAASTYTLSITTKRDVEESADFLREIIKSDSIEDSELKFLYSSLHNVGAILSRCKRPIEALEPIDLCCNAAWTRVRKTSGKKINDTVIEALVGEACRVSGWLVELHEKCGKRKPNSIGDYLKTWSIAVDLLRNPPLPTRLVKQWVRMECKPFKGINRNGATMLYSLLPSSEKVSKRTRGLLLEQELQVYSEMRTLNPEFCKKMKKALISTLLEVYTGKEFYLQKSRILIAKASESRTCGAELDKIRQYLSEAIDILGLLYDENSSSTEVCNQLADAYCLRALCTQEDQPSSQQIIEDIKIAIKIWSETSEAHQAGQFSIVLMYNLIDILSMKGNIEVLCSIYKMIFKIFKWKKISKENMLATLWQSRRLHHGLCASAVDESFIKTFSEHYREEEGNAENNDFESMQFWIDCMKTQPLKVGFQLKFSFMCNIFSDVSHADNHAIISDVTIEEVRKAASDLISQVPISPPKAFQVACLYYDLAERLISNGKLSEALFYSMEAQTLRQNRFQENFEYLGRQSSPCSFISLHMQPLAAISALECRHVTFDYEDLFITPWSSLQCYLESLLQVAVIHESLGNKSDAESMSRKGKDISTFQGFSLFIVAFSVVLGKLYLKQRQWTQAEEELRSAKRVLTRNQISCEKCRLVFQVAIDQQLVNLYRSRNNHGDGSKAVEVYNSALKKMDGFEWGTPTCDFGEASTISKDTHTMATRARMEKQKSDGNCEVTSCDKANCWHCLVLKVKKSGSLNDFVLTKWEMVRRRLSIGLHVVIGKCFRAEHEIHEAHKHFFVSIALLVNKSMSQSAMSTFNPKFLLNFIEEDILGDVLSVEYSAIIYIICWFTLQSSHGKANKGKATKAKAAKSVHICCDMSNIPIARLVSLLMRAFTRCREVPVLFQKISRLLAVIWTLSMSVENFSMPRTLSDAISKSHQASFFHQASLGCHLNHQLFYRNVKKKLLSVVDFQASGSTSFSLNYLRTAPESHHDLEGFILNFFQGLPSATIICISMLGEGYTSLVREILDYDRPVNAWILLSRLNGNGQPVVMLLPVNSIKGGSSLFNSGEEPSTVRQWQCPWGHTMVDQVAPGFKQILKHVHALIQHEDTEQKRKLRDSNMKKVDQCLKKIVGELEDSWFGPWRCLFLGGWSDSKHLEAQKNVMEKLKLIDGVDDVHEGILQCIMRGGENACHSEPCLSKLFLKNGCYVGCNTAVARTSKAKKVESLSSSVGKFILDSIKREDRDSVSRDPIILVLDMEVQMLPWENLPVLSNQEVYRMPSVASINHTLQRCCQRLQDENVNSVIPLIDPSDAYYLLNPDRDLPHLQRDFEKWFIKLKMEGRAGAPATSKELTAALTNHDLFLYLGHGNGLKYISSHQIRALESCGAAFLFGCSSGSLSLNGPYAPCGAALDYIVAGCPLIIGTLWTMDDEDINLFTKKMLKDCLEETQKMSVTCPQCGIIAARSEEMDINSTPETQPSQCISCKNKPRVGSFVRKARDACSLPFFTGTAIICYGVPTGLRKKNSKKL